MTQENRYADHLAEVAAGAFKDLTVPATARYQCPVTGEMKEWPSKEDGKLVSLSELGF